MNSNSSVDKIKDRLSIVDVISSYINVIQAGKNFKAKCPFHNEKTPSFFISPDRGSYYCFGCGAKGDIFSFVEQFEGLDFYGSLKLLAERAGVTLEFNSNYKKDDKEKYFEIMEEATSFFEKNYEANDKARAYLLGRGLTDKIIKDFRVGFAEDSWQSLFNYLSSKGYKNEDIEKVGLIKIKDGRGYDRFRSRIIFPICDSSGRVIAFSGRIFGKDDKEEAKYLNSPDTPLFNKSNVLFGIDKAKTAIRTRGYSIIVEGQMDLLMSHQAGFTNTVAVSGTAFSDSLVDNESKINNLGLIKRLSPNIIFAFDGDSAGLRASYRASKIALSLDMQIKVATLREGKDPAEIILSNVDEWKNIIKESKNVISFELDKIIESTKDTRLRGKKIREIIFPLLILVKSSIEKSAYIEEMRSKTGIPAEAIISDFEDYERGHREDMTKQEISQFKDNPKIKKKEILEKRLAGVIFWQENNENEIKELNDFLNNIENVYLEEIRRNYEPYKETLVFEVEKFYEEKEKDIGRDIREIILNLEEELLNEKKLLLGDLNTEDKLIEFNKILKRIEEIKNNRLS